MSWPLDGNIPDHPIIRNMEATGYPDGRYPPDDEWDEDYTDLEDYDDE